MRNITILGAGKSSIALIDYLIEHAPREQWEISVADLTVNLAMQKTKNRPYTYALQLNMEDEVARRNLLAGADVVISMLPAAFHFVIAKDCVLLKKHLVTPSYVSEAMQKLDAEAGASGLIFMNEVGLDPGIDHMSAMQAIEHLKAESCTITGFKSHCGGLIAPVSDNNPWHYKFTWNPRNVVLAGQGDGGIRYRENGALKELSYEKLFASTGKIAVKGFGAFESYPNRDSLKYISEYGLDDVQTMYRGTLRVPPFCKAWACLVKLGLTIEKEIPVTALKSYKKEILQFLNITESSEEYLLLNSLGLFEQLDRVKSGHINPAKFLQQILEEKWKLQPGDKDMVVMIHEIEYSKQGKKQQLQSSLVVLGKDEEHTAMAVTVGLPVAMITKMILNGKIERRGVLIPKYAEIYNPILAELKNYGLAFKEEIFDI